MATNSIAYLIQTIKRQQMHINSCAPRFLAMHTMLLNNALAELKALGYEIKEAK